MTTKIVGLIYFKNAKGKFSIPLVGTKKYPVIYIGLGELGGENPKYIALDNNQMPLVIMNKDAPFPHLKYNLIILDYFTRNYLFEARNIRFVNAFENKVYFK